ncbi:MAG: RNA polymerase factor sigma-54 [Bradyrhizobium sp.]|nr:MAG: RNA polymerase factor sigma-54 [Bradyrhizobium sp.]
MALANRLAMRQGQSMVLTPQLLQAIKLLQMPNAELSAFIEAELERNPLLERADELPAHDPAGESHEVEAAPATAEPGDWASESLESDPEALARNLGTEIDNAFELERPTSAPAAATDEGQGLSSSAWSGATGRGGDEAAPDLAAYVAQTISFSEHLTRQAMMVVQDPSDRMIAAALIDALDEAGYLSAPLDEIAQRIGAPLARVEAVLTLLHGLEPTGVFARDLAECLALQLIERDRYDPAMQGLIANLPALARRDFATLRRACGVDDADIADMIGEIRRLDPKPARSFGAPPEPPAIPDVFVTAAPDHSWRIELNSDALPRVLVNETYAARIKRGATRDEDKQFISANLQTANWLTKSLEQRARTILNVASEIVRRQDSFFIQGVAGLRPLNLKAVADAIGVHESTVSRATSNKFIQTPRGLFEMKYFFTTSIASVASGPAQAHSAESVRFRIKQMIDAENPAEILSDDVIVTRLRKADIVVARRTVAKYRDSLRIPSSVERRRVKMGDLRPIGASAEPLSL